MSLDSISYWLHNASNCTRAHRVQLATQAAGDGRCRPRSDASSADTQQPRLSLRFSRFCNRPPRARCYHPHERAPNCRYQAWPRESQDCNQGCKTVWYGAGTQRGEEYIVKIYSLPVVFKMSIVAFKYEFYSPQPGAEVAELIIARAAGGWQGRGHPRIAVLDCNRPDAEPRRRAIIIQYSIQ